MSSYSDQLKIRLWFPTAKQMRHFATSGKFGIFLPSVEDTVFLGEGIPMRFTGKKDCKDNELYEGDIFLDNRGFLKVIRYGLYTAYNEYMENVGFYTESGPNDFPQPIGPTEKYAERVGNIYENPELLA